MLQDPNVERYVQEAIKPLIKEIEKQGKLIEILNEALRKHNVSGQVCSFYMSGMDTSGKCNNCGKNQWEH
ncbi:MAG: hypothetical protein ACK50L_02435 [Bacteroidota bacterium]